ncbi:hypothetical protein FRB96_001576 [Tulasnella sp. 330]|nr:hypothetical protein FRB96_001576 [Tulasnella sp. 330]KAG8878383.1 hypothetical protein FRB97_002546 [Tulasnella sp. 331]KAG8884480.1 hypothetical protein FRB98_002379 [Tulasnella sp. 332]
MATSNQIVSIPTLDDLVKAYTSKPAHGLAGVAIIAVNKDNTVVYSGAFGKRSLDSANAQGEKMTLDTVHWLASATKLMTAVAVMQCVERGQISLDETVGKICPELAELEILEGFEDDGSPKMRKAKNVPTLRMLLAHTAGFGYQDHHPILMQWAKKTGFPESLAYAQISAAKTPVMFEPGSDWAYGVGLDWAGQIVERLNNCSLGEYMEKNIWKPLGMLDTTFNPEKRTDLDPRQAGVWFRSSDGKLSNGPHRLYPIGGIVEDQLGGIGAYSTCADFSKLLSAILRDGDGILTKESVDEMFRPQYTGKTTVLPLYKGLLHNFGRLSEDDVTNFGLTLDINVKDIPGRRAAGSGSWGGALNLLFWVDRETGMAVTIFQQVIPPGDEIAVQFFEEFETALYQELRK